MKNAVVLTSLLWLHVLTATPLQAESRRVSGVVVTNKDEAVKGVTVIAGGVGREPQSVITNEDGEFTLEVPDETITLSIKGQYIATECGRHSKCRCPLSFLWRD